MGFYLLPTTFISKLVSSSSRIIVNIFYRVLFKCVLYYPGYLTFYPFDVKLLSKTPILFPLIIAYYLSKRSAIKNCISEG